MKLKLFMACIGMLGTAGGVFAGAQAPGRGSQWPRAVLVYKEPSCGCCANYVGYLRAMKYTVTIVDLDGAKLQEKKRALGIPASLGSCHTTVTSGQNYFVEGHIPYEAIEKMLAEMPKILGIGMPGMPHASPGMPGHKTESFFISQVSRKGIVSPFLTM